MNNLTLASRLTRAVAVLTCVLAQWWPVANYAGPSPPGEFAAVTAEQNDADLERGTSCRPLGHPGTVTIQRHYCAP
jgi:hypothetical protein